ncbi:hypothetical protein ACQPZF_27475 [Actinosynnema sp. CS-041913]|uniref:hypothetical protein n=1 Tax=Actinosynnema sp. CS-041913 TaxID=3239917 RepID=UPI003D9473A8
MVALIDDRSCSLATVRHGARLVGVGGEPLLVVLRLRRALPWLSGGMAPFVSWDDEVEAESFEHAAGVLAPTGVPWDFRAVYDLARLELPRPATVLVAGHHRLWRRPWPAGVRAMGPCVVVACDRGSGGERRAHEGMLR